MLFEADFILLLKALLSSDNLSFSFDGLQANRELILQKALPNFRELCAHFLQCLFVHLKQVTGLGRLNGKLAPDFLVDDCEVFFVTGA